MSFPDLALLAATQLIEEQQRASLLRSHSFEPRHRVLLVGPPGNGKTSLAEAIAESLAVPLFIVRYEAMIGSFLGETAGRLKRVFDYARTTPCVLFFDEFDAVGKERGDTHETGEIKRVVTSLLMQIDELPSYVVVIAATNHAELLDRAVWRRFELRLSLPAPTEKQLAALSFAGLAARHSQAWPWHGADGQGSGPSELWRGRRVLSRHSRRQVSQVTSRPSLIYPGADEIMDGTGAHSSRSEQGQRVMPDRPLLNLPPSRFSSRTGWRRRAIAARPATDSATGSIRDLIVSVEWRGRPRTNFDAERRSCLYRAGARHRARVEGSLEDFYAQARAIGLEYLGDYEDEFTPSDDFYDRSTPKRSWPGAYISPCPMFRRCRNCSAYGSATRTRRRMPTGGPLARIVFEAGRCAPLGTTGPYPSRND